MTTRRELLAASGAVTASLAIFHTPASAQSTPANFRASSTTAVADRIPVPEGRRIRVAFLLGVRGANVIDVAGPWEVFQDTMVGNRMPFQLYTVGATSEVTRMTGGLLVQPNYSIEDAPQPDLIVVPALAGNTRTTEWLRTASQNTAVTMSVCTGAFQLAAAGLLDGLNAATHHQFWDRFEERFPDVRLNRGLRFVDNGRIAAAGGLTSGVDMALHIVRRYFGMETAQRTADYMEYQSDSWRV